MKKTILFIFISVSFYNHIPAQSRICECATSFTPLATNDFESFFSPSLIKARKFREVRVVISPAQKNSKLMSDTSFKMIGQPYTEETFSFNIDGYAVSNSTFYLGIPNYFYSYKRNNKNEIVQYISQYFDSTGRISRDSRPEITDYSFDEYSNIVKRKKRDFNGAVLPDEKSEYTITEYNETGWKLKETTHYYWDFEKQPNHFYTTNYSYTKNGKIETARQYEGKKLFLTTTANYDDEGKPMLISSFNHFMSKPSFKETFKYDSLGRLIKYIHTNGGGGGSECPNKGNYTNEFKYSREGFLVEQKHSFANTVCLLRFEYK